MDIISSSPTVVILPLLLSRYVSLSLTVVDLIKHDFLESFSMSSFSQLSCTHSYLISFYIFVLCALCRTNLHFVHLLCVAKWIPQILVWQQYHWHVFNVFVLYCSKKKVKLCCLLKLQQKKKSHGGATGWRKKHSICTFSPRFEKHSLIYITWSANILVV